MIANVIIVVVLVVFAFGGFLSIIKRFKGESCCGGGSTEVKIEPSDKNKKNYPYKAIVIIDGMHCKKCAERIQNKINNLNMWAKVNLKRKTATILLKENNCKDLIVKTITDAGYTVISYKEE